MDEIEGALHQSRILIVDDAIISLMYLRTVLMQGGFTDIRTAESAEEALQTLDSYQPDIIILDLMMEGMDGFECCRRIRAREEGGDVPILIQTALTEHADKIRTFREGATDFISKPLFADELYARVIVHLEKQLAMKKLLSYKQRVEHELRSARDLQTAILPRNVDIETISASAQLEIASYFKPSSELGGDFWGIRQLAADKVAFWIVDFSGHGVAAALNVFRLHTCLHEESDVADDPGKYLGEMNERLLQLLPRGQFATMLYGVIDTSRNELNYASAGTPHPIILRAQGGIHMLNGAGRPLGIVQQDYATRRASFSPGESVCFYSDALTETVDIHGKFIDEQEVAALLERHAESSQQALRQLVDHYDAETLPRDRRDDLTIGIIRRMPREGGTA
jgi:sigma-B regulation protein RsbU (phosphoserine phosphatase)